MALLRAFTWAHARVVNGSNISSANDPGEIERMPELQVDTSWGLLREA
jgi:hypothetical protein